MSDLSVSIVVYRSDPAVLFRSIASLGAAARHLRSARPDMAPIRLTLIDNGAETASDAISCPAIPDADQLVVTVLAGQGNVGYGVGHNLAILAEHPSKHGSPLVAMADSGLANENADSYHLILNPDVDLDRGALSAALDFMDREIQVAALSPRIVGGDGHLQYLCRRYPSLIDLFVRGFLPARWRKGFQARLAAYELRAEIDLVERLPAEAADMRLRPEIISGCFMLYRTKTLRQLGGFDPRYFLYFEDYDLSLRTTKLGQLAYVPSVRIVHFGGGAARKGKRHVALFLRSAFQFFNRFGWRLF